MEVVDKHGNKTKEKVEVLVPAFKIVHVFDVSQTEGEPLPTLGVDELVGTVEPCWWYLANATSALNCRWLKCFSSPVSR